MAVELAKQEGIKIKMVIVADDLALTDGKGITGARGIAGTLFVHKIAGACASNSNSNLDDVYSIAEKISHEIGSLGVALTTCNIPGTSSYYLIFISNIYI
jgi:dihydroxyacetone kinase